MKQPREERQSILIVDDEKNILFALKRLLRKEGYALFLAQSGQEGLEILEQQPVDLIISDQRMPGMSGTEFLEKAARLRPETVRIVLSGYADLDTITESINRGHIYKFLMKPWDDEELKSVIRDCLEVARLRRENTELTEKLKKRNEELEWLTRHLEDEVEKRTKAVHRRNIALQQYQYILHQLPVGVLGVGDNGRVAFANKWVMKRLSNRLPDPLDEELETVVGAEISKRLLSLGGDSFFSMEVDKKGTLCMEKAYLKGAVIQFPSGSKGFVLCIVDCPRASKKGDG